MASRKSVTGAPRKSQNSSTHQSGNEANSPGQISSPGRRDTSAREGRQSVRPSSTRTPMAPNSARKTYQSEHDSAEMSDSESSSPGVRRQSSIGQKTEHSERAAAEQEANESNGMNEVRSERDMLMLASSVARRSVLVADKHRVRLTFVSAANLTEPDSTPRTGRSDPYCTCEVEGKPHTKVVTPVAKGSSPVFNHKAIIREVVQGDRLEFNVFDQDKNDLIGSAYLESAKFLVHGFTGDVYLTSGPACARSGSLHIAIETDADLDSSDVLATASAAFSAQRIRSRASVETHGTSSNYPSESGDQPRKGTLLAGTPEATAQAALLNENVVAHALTTSALFRNIPGIFPPLMASHADRLKVKPGETLELGDGKPLYIIERGALRLRVGDGPVVILGAGTIVNTVGYLSLLLQEETRVARRRDPHGSASGDRAGGAGAHSRAMGYDIQDYVGAPPLLYCGGDKEGKDREDGKEKDKAQVLTDSQRCFYNVCPYAALRKSNWNRMDYMKLLVAGAEAGEVPTGASQHLGADYGPIAEGGAELATIPRPAIFLEAWVRGEIRPPSSETKMQIMPTMDVTDDSAPSVPGQLSKKEQLKKEFMERFTANAQALTATWQVLQRSMGVAVLPGAPPEVLWNVAEASLRLIVTTGQEVVAEGDEGDEGEALIVMDSGVAIVEKLVADSDREVIGRLRSGAIIGDLCLIGAGVPRAATVRAKTDVEAVKVPCSSLSDVLCRFPGALASCEDRLSDAAAFLQERLLTRTEVASSLNLFHGCDLRFVNDIANAGEHRTVLCGRAVVEQGNTSGTLFVLEHGRCLVEVRGLGKVGEVPAGNCFGERTLLGISKEANATVRVSSPMALVLAIPRQALHHTLAMHPEEQAHFDELKRTPMVGRVQGSRVRHVELFRPCKTAFLEVLNRTIEPRGYMPGQTIVVEGQEEEDPKMFVLTGGMVVAERQEHQLARMSPGATFGELAMLGVTQQRAVTVRAATFCFVMGIRRSAFFSALEEYPDEEDHFQQVLSDSHYYAGAMWPCLQGVPTRLLYLLDLYAEPRRCEPGDPALGMPPITQAAILILEGEVSLRNQDGKQVGVLTSGSCFNEQILVGVKEEKGMYLVPKTICDVRILTKITWQKVMDEFPEEQARARSSVLRYKAEQAERKLNFAPGKPGALRNAVALLRTSSESFAESIRNIVETRLYEPEAVIAKPFPEDEAQEAQLFLLLEGEAFRQDGLGKHLVKPGTALGESSLLGVEKSYACTWVAGRGTCVVQVLGRVAFDKLLEGFPAEEEIIEKLRRQVPETDSSQLWKRLQWSTPFRTLRPTFVAALAKAADIQIFAKSQTILHKGEPCKLGESVMYLVLGGKVMAVGDVGTVFGTIGPGEVLGEVGAFGLTQMRTTTAKCWEEGLVCTARFRGPAIETALTEHPTAFENLTALFGRLENSNKAIEDKRKNWLKEVAVPTLERTPLLAGCPVDFLFAVATTLTETKYAPGDTIAVIGEPLKAMLVFLEGSAEMLSKAEVHIGSLGPGSVFGEVAALGLFSVCMAVVRAITPCRVLLVPEVALKRALPCCAQGEMMIERFRSLVVSRHDQVVRGMPIMAMGIGANAEDVSVRAIALLAEYIYLEPGDVWEPVPDFDPCGPCFGVLVQGRARVEMSSDHHTVMSLNPGGIFLEGLAAEYGAVVRADTECEAYRIRRSDFMMAVTSNPSTQDHWIWRFKLQERNVREVLHRRLDSAKGLLAGGTPHLKDREIQAWKVRTRQNVSRARKLRKENSEPKLPMLGSASRSATYTSGFRTGASLGSTGGSSRSMFSAIKSPERLYSLGIQLPRLALQSSGSPGSPGDSVHSPNTALGNRMQSSPATGMAHAQSTPALPIFRDGERDS